MPNLSNAGETAAIIQKYNFTFQKRFGQNFLIDPHVLDKIIDAAMIDKDDFVIEIGPGIGTMTQLLCERAGYVSAIEIDKELIPILRETLAPYDNISVHNADVMKIDLAKLIEEESGGRRVKVVANLPYYITTPIIMGLLENHIPVESITVMVQKEVAERMQCGPGTKSYGALSLAVQFYSEPYIAANVPPNCFMPRPNVGSSVIRLTLHKVPPVAVKDEKLLFKIIRGAFNQRRKTLVNALSNYSELDRDKETVANVLNELGIDLNIRGEALNLSDFAAIADRLI